MNCTALWMLKLSDVRRLPFVSSLFLLLILVSPITVAGAGHRPNAAMAAPTAGLSWTFTGNEQAIVKVTIDESAPNQARWGVLFRNDAKIASFPGGYDDYFLDTGLGLGQTYVYKLIAYTKNLATGEIYASGPLYTPEIVAGEVGGDIPINMTWDGGVWNKTDAINIVDGATLTIKPGTTIVGVYGQMKLVSGKLLIDGATLEDLTISFAGVTLELDNTLSIKNSTLLNTHVNSRAAKVFENNRGSSNVITLYDFVGPSVRYHSNVMPDSDFYVDYQADADGQTDVTLENNEFGSLSILDIVPINRLNEARITIRDNQIAGNLVIRAASANQAFSGNIDVADNRVAGMEFEFAAGMYVMENTIMCSPTPPGGGVGIDLDSGVSGGHFSGNSVRNCGAAIFLHNGYSSSPPSYNAFGQTLAPNAQVSLWAGENNIFVDNAFELVSIRSEAGSNTWHQDITEGGNIIGGPFAGGNWYGDYDGLDADGDFIGDTPYVIDEDNVDQYPLVLANPGPDFAVDPFQFHESDVIVDANRRYVLPVDVFVANDGWAPADDVPVIFYGNAEWLEEQIVPHFDIDSGPIPLHLDWDITPLLLKDDGFRPRVKLEVAIAPGQGFGDTIQANNRRSYQSVMNARPDPDFKTSIPMAQNYFVHQTPLDNRLSATVDWNGAFSDTTSAPYGDLWFDLNDTITSVPGQEWGASRIYDMGADFQSSLSCGNNTLQVWASHPIAGGALTSPKTVLQPTVLPYPSWVEWVQANIPDSDAALAATANPFHVEYGYSFPYPNPALEAQWTPPAGVPYLGDNPLGLASSQAAVHVTGLSTGAGSAAVTGTIGYDLAGVTAPGTLSGVGQSTLSCAEGMALPRAELNVQVTTPVTVEHSLVDVVPGTEAAGDWATVGRYMDWLVHATQVPATFTPNVDMQTLFRAQNGQLSFVPDTVTAPVTTHVNLVSQPAPGLSASVYGGGQASVAIQVPPDPGYLQGVAIGLYFEAQLQNGPFEDTFGYSVDCQYPGECQTVGIAGQPRLVSRDYAGPEYATFAGPSRAASASAAETVLVTNAYPHAEPALAIRPDGQRLLAYVHDDTGKPQGRGGEIRVLRHDGAWSAPATVTDDQQPDYAPALAYDADGDGLLLWERATLATGITPTLDLTYAQSLEMAYATYSGGSWSSPTLLTSNGLMDRAPRLVRGMADGALLALWETGSGHDALGTATHPLTLTYALWDGAAWSAPAPAVSGLQDVVHVAVAAYSATQAALAYVVDADGVLSTTADTDLYYSTFDGAAWSAPALIADGASLADSAPALAYDAAGNRHLLWLRARDLVWLQDSWDLGDATVVRTGSTAAGWLGFSLAPDADGNLALLWQTLDENGSNLAHRIYDGAAQTWSADRPLLADPDVEASPSPALADGTLYAAYAKAPTEFVTRTVEVAPGEWLTVMVPQAGASDLVFMEHDLGRDLTFESLAVTPANPAPGQAATVTALLHNASDLAVAAPEVALFDGPDAIATVSLPGTLGGGHSVPVEVAWAVPVTPAAPHSLRAVADPNALVVETDETNNEIERTTSRPDLEVQLFHTSHQAGQLTLTTVLRNTGVVDVVQPFTLAFRLEDPDTGTLADQVSVDVSVPAGGAITWTHTLTDLAPLAGLGDTLWAVADAEAVVIEMNEGNNNGYAFFGVLPDLVLAAEDIQGAGPVSVLVHNEGLRTATSVSLSVREGGPDGPLVYSSVLGDLAVGDSRTVQFMPPTGQIELWAEADPDHTIAEMNEGNNLAIRSLHVAYWVYLPTIAR